LVATYAAYVLTGHMSLWLAIPPGYASPLFPPAGVALATVLVWRWPAALGVALGSFSINLLVRKGAPLDVQAMLAPALIGLGAMAQALVGALLLRRCVSQPMALTEPGELLRFYGLGALLACVISASVAVTSLTAIGLIPRAAALTTWGVWWAGDMLGVLIGAPIVLTLIGRPRTEWAARRMTVGLPMVVVTLLMGLGIHEVLRLDQDRLRNDFEREANSAASATVSRLQEPLHALQATRGVLLASKSVTRDEFRRATQAWLVPGSGLQALGWAEHVAHADLPGFEAEVRADGAPGYHVFDRRDTAGAPPGDAFVVALRYIEPVQRNAGALGVNIRSIPAARAATERAAQAPGPAATAGFRLTQGGVGVVVYQAVGAAAGSPADATPHGVVFATVRPDELLGALLEALPAHLQVCLVDSDPQSDYRVLVGSPDCARDAPTAQQHVRGVAFGGRQWEVRVWARPAGLQPDPASSAWAFSLVGLLATSLLGALLLTVTGRTRRIERAVTERTADLEHEVAGRKRTEGALRDSEQRLRNILDHVPIGVIYTDLDERIKETNPKLCEMLGYSADELTLMNACDLSHPDDVRADAELTRRLLAGDIPMFRRQKRVLAKSGRVMWVVAVTTVLRDAAGRPHRLVGVVEDITEHLRLEDAERARERAEAANLAKSDFLSRMSHELRTPLNAMLGFAQLLELDRQQPLAPHQMEWTAQIQHAGWHLLHMINDTLDLSRIESGTLRLRPEALEVADLVSATRSLLEHHAHKRSVEVREQLDPQAEAVVGDLTRVKQILTNLLSNAIKYNVDGGRVTLTTRLYDAQTVQIEIADTGMGMSEQQLTELFQPFNRLGRELSGQEGTGIGLVISQRLAELMGGTLRAYSEAGIGSTFVLQLPRARRADATRALADDDKPLVANYRQRVVHYVEDNETNAEVMRGILAQRPQIRLEVSGTGLDGLAAIRLRPPSLILLDMHLPDIDGLELLRHLKHDDDLADIPVVVVSADATGTRISEALSTGASQYLTKPVNVAEILSVLDEQLERLDTRFG
jgi:PAS domain S-box-containing protein